MRYAVRAVHTVTTDEPAREIVFTDALTGAVVSRAMLPARSYTTHRGYVARCRNKAEAAKLLATGNWEAA